MKKRKMMSAAALMMAGTLTLQSVQWPVFKVFADDAENADGTLAYFVDCGDYDVTTVSEEILWGFITVLRSRYMARTQKPVKHGE